MPPPTHPGSLIAGKYRVERVLGQGGMGVVVAARHLDLGERVAIKFPVVAGHERGRIAARLIREGRAAMKIRSEHVARVYDVGTLDTGEPYLVMEYLVGRDLAAVVAADGPLPVGAAVEYVLQAIEALAEAHARGIVHRDIKPSNLFLSRRPDGSPIVKVIDFGISKNRGAGSEASLTRSEGALGTPLFMAPEQMASARETDARSDIWSLGATLHALVTGEPPFSGGSIVDIHMRILEGTPLLRSALPDAPPSLEAALQRCMQRDAALRFANVAELAEALFDVAPEGAHASINRAARILSSASLDGDTGANAKRDTGGDSEGDGPADEPRAPTEPAMGTGTSAGVSWLEAGSKPHSDGAKTITGQSLLVPAVGATGVAPEARLPTVGYVVAGALAVALVFAGYKVGSLPTKAVVATAAAPPPVNSAPLTVPVPEQSAGPVAPIAPSVPVASATNRRDPPQPKALASVSNRVGSKPRSPAPTTAPRTKTASPPTAAPPSPSAAPTQHHDPLANPD